MMGETLVTVIVPAFNAQRYVQESLESILAQTYRPTEIIFMDDASTDATAEIVGRYADRITLVRQPQNRGIYGNVNDGLTLARGTYVAVYHADDVYHPTIVEEEVGFLETHREAGAVFCLDVFIGPDGRERGRLDLPPELRGERPLEYRLILNALLRYKNTFLRCPSSMVRRSVYRDVGPYRDAEFRNSADLDMWLRIARAHPIGILERHLFRYRHGHGNSAQRYHHRRTDAERFFTMVDEWLGRGDAIVALPDALTAYEAHRAEDGLRRALSFCALGNRCEGRRLLRDVHLCTMLASGQVRRGRLLALLAILHVLLRLPVGGPNLARLLGR